MLREGPAVVLFCCRQGNKPEGHRREVETMAIILDSEGYMHVGNGACEECQGTGSFFRSIWLPSNPRHKVAIYVCDAHRALFCKLFAGK